MTESPGGRPDVPAPPAALRARFTVHGSTARELGRQAFAYATALAGPDYAVSSYTLSPVDLTRTPGGDVDPDRLEWGCNVEVTLQLRAR